MGKSNGLHQIMILPIATRETQTKHTTTAPQGLILRHKLDAFAYTYNGLEAKMTGEDRTIFEVEKVEGQYCEVSISHDKDIAQAVALVPSLD